MFNSTQIKKAWKIRKESAVKFGCRVMEISWKECLKMSKEENSGMTEGLKLFIEHKEKSIELYESKPKKSDNIMATREKQIQSLKKMIDVAKTNEMPNNNDVKVAYMMIENKVMRIINNKC